MYGFTLALLHAVYIAIRPHPFPTFKYIRIHPWTFN